MYIPDMWNLSSLSEVSLLSSLSSSTNKRGGRIWRTGADGEWEWLGTFIVAKPMNLLFRVHIA
jgi:hypothetical protein